jgi:hypothetical protein
MSGTFDHPYQEEEKKELTSYPSVVSGKDTARPGSTAGRKAACCAPDRTRYPNFSAAHLFAVDSHTTIRVRMQVYIGPEV